MTSVIAGKTYRSKQINYSIKFAFPSVTSDSRRSSQSHYAEAESSRLCFKLHPRISIMIELGAFLTIFFLLLCWLLFLVNREIERELPTVRAH